MARLVFTLEDGTEIETELDADVISIGRHPESEVVLPSPSVSAHHATVKRRGDSYFVQDLATTNGTKLNGVEVEEARLEDGDRLSFGDVPAVVHLSDGLVKKSVETDAAEKAKAKDKAKIKDKDKDKDKDATVQGNIVRPDTVYPRSSGCGGFIVLMAFLVFAFITGICLRFAKEHGGFLPQMMIEKFNEKMKSGDSAPLKDDKK